MQRYAAPELKIFFFYTALKFRTQKFLQNSKFSFKQNVRVFCFTNKGLMKNVWVFTRKKGLNE